MPFHINRKSPPLGAPIMHGRERDACVAIAMQNLFPESDAIKKHRAFGLPDLMFCEIQPALDFSFEPVVCGVYLTHTEVLDALRQQHQRHSPHHKDKWLVMAALEHMQYGSHFVLLVWSRGLICEVDAMSESAHFERRWQWIERAQNQARQFAALHILYDLSTRSAKLLEDKDLAHLVSLTQK